jgi:type VI protein secretion system component Hcp
MGFFDTFEESGGNLTVPIYWDGTGTFLKAAIGSSTTTPAGSDFVHEYKSSTTDFIAFTCELQRGSDSTAGLERFLGLKVASATINVEAGSEMTMSMELIGKTSDARTSGITANYASHAQIYHYEAGGLTWNGNTYYVRSMEISIDNKIERRNLLGSKQTYEPDSTDFREITMTCELDLENNNLYNDMIAGTESAAEIVFTQTGGSNTCGFKFNNAIITDYSDPISTVGRLTASVTFTALSTTTTEAFKVRLVNTNASATGA